MKPFKLPGLVEVRWNGLVRRGLGAGHDWTWELLPPRRSEFVRIEDAREVGVTTETTLPGSRWTRLDRSRTPTALLREFGTPGRPALEVSADSGKHTWHLDERAGERRRLVNMYEEYRWDDAPRWAEESDMLEASFEDQTGGRLSLADLIGERPDEEIPDSETQALGQRLMAALESAAPNVKSVDVDGLGKVTRERRMLNGKRREYWVVEALRPKREPPVRRAKPEAARDSPAPLKGLEPKPVRVPTVSKPPAKLSGRVVVLAFGLILIACVAALVLVAVTRR